MNKLACTLLSLLAVALVLGVGTATAQNLAPDHDYGLGYFTNANAAGAPSAQLRVSNDGLQEAADYHDLCANIYVFNTAEEMQECCSCEVSSDGYLDLSVNTNLLGNSSIMAPSPPGGSSRCCRVWFPPVAATLPMPISSLELKAGSLTFRREQPRERSASPRRL
jgi:hypothetical protein